MIFTTINTEICKVTIMIKRTIFILVLICNFWDGQQALGQQVSYVGIQSSNFNYFASSQRNSNWCWAASLQMIFNYYGVGISQEQIVARSYGVDPYGRLPNWTGSFQVITANLNNWNIDNFGRQYGVSASL